MSGFLKSFGMIAALTSAAAAQQRPSAVAEAARFTVSSDLVMVNATVLDPAGRPVSGLTRDRFQLFDGRAQERIASFTEEETPVSVVVLADVSHSMDGKLAVCARAAAQLVESTLPGDEFALITFSNAPHLDVPWTAEGEAVLQALRGARPGGTTALFDAILFATQYTRHARNARRVVLIVSDGGDNHSRYTATQARHRLQEANLELYAIHLNEFSFGLAAEEQSANNAMEHLCERVSGRYVALDDLGGLPDAVARISREIRSQYVLGYRPTRWSGSGRYHRMGVKVAPPEGLRRVSVYARPGWREPQ